MKLAIISGGSRGLGAALCAHYAAAGWRVLECSRSGSGEHSLRLDFADPRTAAARLEQALQALSASKFEEIVAISNAARLGPVGRLSDYDADQLIEHLQVNMASGMLFMATVARVFATAACPKTLVNIGSGAALRPFQGWSLYCASKAGLERFVECLALEQAGLRDPFVALNISPGVIDTDMQAEIRAADEGGFPDRQRFIDLKEQGDLQPAARVAAAIAHIVALRLSTGGRYEVRDYLPVTG